MILIDSHCHLYAEQFSKDRDNCVEKALSEGVRKFLLPNIDIDSIEPMHQLVEDYPNQMFPMMGLHPCSVDQNWENALAKIYSYFESQTYPYIAVGEIGIDLYWSKDNLAEQQAAFREQIRWAKQLNLPIAIHVRDSFEETFAILEEEKSSSLRGVFHCFTGTEDQAKRAIKLGFKLGIGGVVTFKNGGLDKTLANVDLEQLILETDSPYLAPHPNRGQRNEPSYLLYIAEKLAIIKDCSIELIARKTTDNCNELFKL